MERFHQSELFCVVVLVECNENKPENENSTFKSLLINLNYRQKIKKVFQQFKIKQKYTVPSKDCDTLNQAKFCGCDIQNL